MVMGGGGPGNLNAGLLQHVPGDDCIGLPKSWGYLSTLFLSEWTALAIQHSLALVLAKCQYLWFDW